MIIMTELNIPKITYDANTVEYLKLYIDSNLGNLDRLYEGVFTNTYKLDIYKLPISHIIEIIAYIYKKCSRVDIKYLHREPLLYETTAIFIEVFDKYLQILKYLDGENITYDKYYSIVFALEYLHCDTLEYIINTCDHQLIEKNICNFAGGIIGDEEELEKDILDRYHYIINNGISFTKQINAVICKLMINDIDEKIIKYIIDDNFGILHEQSNKRKNSNMYKIFKYMLESGINIETIIDYQRVIDLSMGGRFYDGELIGLDKI